MKTPDQQESKEFAVLASLFLLTPWLPTVFITLTGNKELIPICGSLSATIDIVALGILVAARPNST